MTSIFLFSLILGGGLLGLSLLGDLFGGGDGGLDADLDADTGADPGLALDAFQIFTIRNLTYFLFGFGGIGWLLETFSPGLAGWLIAVTAVLGGWLSAGIATAIFGWIRATDSGWQAEEGSFVGCEGRVILPLGSGKTGRIIVRRGDREHELRALPFIAAAPDPERWKDVVVVEMDGGTARVSPMEALAPAEDSRPTT